MFTGRRKSVWMIALLSFLLLTSVAFGQSIGGTVMDSSRASIPGAEVTARNDGTGIETKTTVNNSGVYNFASLQPGTYTVTVFAPGFQRITRTEIRLAAGSQFNLPFELAVAGTVTEVEVTGAVDSIVLESGSSTGTIMQEETIARIPLVANDALDMVNMMGGVVESSSPVFYAMNQSVAGVTANNINITRDGISVNEIRYNSGLTSPARMNPDLVGEFTMIMSPVDAELGRGAGQIRMTTRSGTNAFHGSGVWNNQNTALDSYSYNDKHRRPELITPLPWRNLNSYTLSASGPIVRNKTFFFVSWDQQISRNKTYVVPVVLTNCARKGIYRWLGNTIGGNLGMTDTDVTIRTQNGGPNPGRSPQRPVVQKDGTPWTNYTFPTDPVLGEFSGMNTAGTVYDQLNFQSVLGPLSAEAYAQVLSDPINCSNYLPGIGPNDAMPTNTNFGVTGNWDDYRTGYDQSGFVSRLISVMPTANDFQSGDGLNTAGYGWTRTNHGTGNIFGQSTADDERKAITFKIDHNINSEHRISGMYSYESSHGVDMEPYWDPQVHEAYGGQIVRKPQTLAISLISTLRPTLLNEFRVGLSRTASTSYVPMDYPGNGNKVREMLVNLTGNTAGNPSYPNYADLPVLIAAGTGTLTGSSPTGSRFYPTTGSHPYGGRSNISTTWGGYDPRWTFSDTITWMKGAHSFKAGVEYRMQQSYQWQNGPPSLGDGIMSHPQLWGGVITAQSPQRTLALTNSSWPDMPKGALDYRRAGVDSTYSTAATADYTYAGVYNLLTQMSGSINSITQYFFAVDSKNPRWNDPLIDGDTKRSDLRNRELAFFFKDDWKVTSDVTLNLGMRYEYYGAPWEAKGMAVGVANGITGAMGISGGDFNNWMPGSNQLRQDGELTRQVLVGPNSSNPDLSIHGKDLNNIAPHVGFSWALPWFGKGKTTLRGGYSISYVKIANYDNTFGYAQFMAYQPAINNSRTYNVFSSGCLAHIPGESQTGCYLDLTNAGKLLPLYQPSTGWVGLPSYQQPMPLDPQWVGKRDQLANMFDPDIVNPYIQNVNMSLTRQINRYLTVDVRYIATLSRKSVSGASTGLNVNTLNLFNSGIFDELLTLRRDGPDEDPNSTSKYPILNGYIKPDTLGASTSGESFSGTRQVWNAHSGSNGNLAVGNLQAIATSINNANCASFGCTNVPGMAAGNVLRHGGAPENLLMSNPQYTQLTVQRNNGTTNYHSMQLQVTMRPVRGLNFQSTYTWSRNLSRGGPVDYRDWNADNYGISGQHRSHTLSHNGSYTLPFGANGFFLRNASGVLKKTIEGWQIGWMGRFSSGIPLSLAASNASLWGGSTRFDQVGPIDTKLGKVEWDDELGYGFFMGKNRFDRILDPQCFDTSIVNSGLRTSCVNSMRALIDVDPNGSDVGYKTLADYNAQTNPVRGTIIFVNPKPGTTGNFRPNTFTGQGTWTLDANMSKTIEFMEGKRLEVRVDAMNIFNHANPSASAGANGDRNVTVSNPTLTINTADSTPFGRIATKAGKRTFQARIRLSF